MDGDWKLLGRHVARRRADLGLSQVEVAHRGPLSLDRVQAIEGAKKTGYRLSTLVALERALEWEAGSVEAVLGGGSPTPLRPASARGTMADVEAQLDENERLVRMMREARELNEQNQQVVEDLIRSLQRSQYSDNGGNSAS